MRPVFTFILALILLIVVQPTRAGVSGFEVRTSARSMSSSMISATLMQSQVAATSRTEVSDDSLYIFEPARPLTAMRDHEALSSTWWGPQLCISGSGYGGGIRVYQELSTSTMLSLDVLMSAARKSEEFEVQDGTYTYVPNKIHRVFILPCMLGLSQALFTEEMTGRMRPILSCGIGLNTVLIGSYDPYASDYFQSLFHAQSEFRPAAFVGVGASVRNSESSSMIIDARYFILPFGGDGVESIRGVPMVNFDGLFLSLSVIFH